MVEDFKAVVLAELRDFMDQHRNMDSRHHNMDLWHRSMDSQHRRPSLVVIPARSAALITEALRVGFRLAGSRASAAEEAFTVAEATGNPV